MAILIGRAWVRGVTVAVTACLLAGCGGSARSAAGSPSASPAASPGPGATQVLSDAIDAVRRWGSGHFDARGDTVDASGFPHHQYVIGDFELGNAAWSGIRSRITVTGQATDEVDRVVGPGFYFLPGTDPNARGTWGSFPGVGISYDPAGNPILLFPAGDFGTNSVPPPLVAVGETRPDRVDTDAAGRSVVTGTVDAWWALDAFPPILSWVQLDDTRIEHIAGDVPIEIALNTDRSIAEVVLRFDRGNFRMNQGTMSDRDRNALRAVRFRIAFTGYGNPVRVDPPASSHDCEKAPSSCPSYPKRTTNLFTPPPFPG